MDTEKSPKARTKYSIPCCIYTVFRFVNTVFRFAWKDPWQRPARCRLRNAHLPSQSGLFGTRTIPKCVSRAGIQRSTPSRIRQRHMTCPHYVSFLAPCNSTPNFAIHIFYSGRTALSSHQEGSLWASGSKEAAFHSYLQLMCSFSLVRPFR